MSEHSGGGGDHGGHEPRDPPELSLHVLANLAKYIEDAHGPEALRAILDPVGLTSAAVYDRKTWASLAQVEHILAEGRALFDTERAFKAAFAHELRALLGPMRYLAYAATPGQVFTQAFRSLPTLSSISRAEVIERGPTHLVVRYFSDKPESKLLCLSRQGQAAALPTLWGLPPAAFEERTCIADGDACCEYRISWYEARRASPTIAGLFLGAAAGAALFAFGIAGAPTLLAVPVLGALGGIGALGGFAYEMRRTHAAHLAVSTEQQQALREIATSDTEARKELLLLNDRQRNWARMLEEQIAERNATFAAVVDRYEETLRRQRRQIRDVSHDLNGRLTVLETQGFLLSEMLEAPTADVKEILEDSAEAINQMEAMVREFVAAARDGSGLFVPSNPEPLIVDELADALRRRLGALSYASGIAISVSKTREAPDTLTVDRMLFDRVLDNLLTNAVKYTQAGRIDLELRGTPGVLTVQLSDTGRGIPEDRLKHIFEPGGSAEEHRAPHSFGLGLSVVVQLLAQIGGRLEVTSKAGVGTTFWAHFPIEPATPSSESRETERDREEVVAEVVSIRVGRAC